VNRSALVTGGSRGIGLSLARVLVAEGYSVTISARNAEQLDRAAELLRRDGGTVETFATDLSEPSGAEALAEAHRAHFGRLDVLINNAGTGFGQQLVEISDRRLDLQLDLNLRAAILCYREAVEMLLSAAAEHSQAWVVNVCSLTAVNPKPWLSVYSASKAGLRAFSMAMNSEFAGRGVRSCAICPGTVATDLTDGLAGPPDDLVSTTDIAEVLQLLLRLSPACRVDEIVLRSSFDEEWHPPES
jgi:NAD(P)-dependent dehydrogenase (short-subunit alcohol dehydrogenase family)